MSINRLIEAGALRQFRHNDGSEGFVFAYDKEIVDRLLASTVSKEWFELTRRLYIELFYCHKQMIEATDENDEPIWVSGCTVPRVLKDAKDALELASGFREGRNANVDNSPFLDYAARLESAAPSNSSPAGADSPKEST